ncbi:hypothetical protein [Ferrimonas lipolytica]|uniref:Uncharacterized protein n=1 Tax=Ferrimonas lipolytica TaxID=2724191 RepID=A0A6H1UI43_9GAMM|nr:hypothetical protein [Ferrimonas lipolytica]QIZ77983.1 hypothetical protein HER31_14415 [Ferrimonas lipolytica]
MRRTTTTIAALLFSSAAFASTAGCQADADPSSRLACYDSMASTIDECQSKTDKLDRLVCFDNISEAIKTVLGANKSSTVTPAVPAAAAATTAAVVAAPTPVATPVDPVGLFGHENKKKEEQAEAIDSISATVTSISTDPYGKFTLTLDNSQRWRQTESGRFKVGNGDTVIISRASFGSFLLKRAGSNKQIRVKRQ